MRGKNRPRAQTVYKAVRISLALLLIVALGVFCLYVPLRTALPAYGFPARAEGEMRVHFLDVGQGDCTIVEMPDGQTLVIDAGDGSFEHENKLIRYLKGLDYTSLSFLATHADIDHYGGFAQLLSLFGADKVYLPAVGSDTAAYQKLLAAAERTECETLSRYDTVELSSGAYCVCLSPYSQGEEDENDSSAVLYLSYGGVSFVFCGDISSTRENLLTREYALAEGIFDSGEYAVRLEETDILKVSHHGSAGASSANWLGLLSPSEAVISCGRGNSYSHPTEEAISRLRAVGAEIWRTDELGDIVVCVSGGAYAVYTDFTE